jgi:hypothetical protein
VAWRYRWPITNKEIVGQYNRFVVEYNAFVQNFRDTIAELRNVTRTQMEAPSVKFARELPEVKYYCLPHPLCPPLLSRRGGGKRKRSFASLRLSTGWGDINEIAPDVTRAVGGKR